MLEWRDHVSEPPSKRTKEEQFKLFYAELLKSINETRPSTREPCDGNNLPNDKGLLQEVSKSYKSIEDYKRRGMSHYGHFGFVLAKLKFIYLTKCSICKVSASSEPADIFKVLSCNRCIHISNSSEF